MASKKMKRKSKNAYLCASSIKNFLRGKGLSFYTKKERVKRKKSLETNYSTELD